MSRADRRFAFPRPSSVFVASVLSGHRALGVVLAGLVYILALSGVLSVFNHELQRWEQPGVPEIAHPHPATIQRAAETVLAQEETTHFYIQLPTRDMPRVVLTTDTRAVFMQPDGSLAGAERHPFTQFVLDLHYYLTVPGVAGLALVGMLGVLLCSLTVSGLLSHPRIFRDAFRFRFGGQQRVTQADIHNRLGVWTSPFVMSNALSGAVLGLMAIVSGAIANLDHGGDVEEVYAPVFGEEPAEDETPAPLADIAAALAFMEREHPGLEPTYVLMHEPKTAGQHLQILAEHPERLIFGDYYNFTAEGTPLGATGMADGLLGQQVAASAYRLHFGSFGGLPVKLAYGVFGTGLAVIISAGMNIYFLRRRQRRGAADRLECAWQGILWGVPLALAACFAAGLVAPAAPMTPVFWLALACAVIAAVLLGGRQAAARLGRQASGGAILFVLAANLVVHQGALASPAFWGVSGFGAAVALVLFGMPLIGRRLGTAHDARSEAALAE